MTFVCVLRSGGVYDARWVERLCRQASRHLKPKRTICLTDGASLDVCGYVMPGPCPLEIVRLAHDWPGWWSKIEIFRPGLFSGPCWYADLDTLIFSPLPDHCLPLSTPPLLMLDDFFAPARPASGVMAWIPGPATERIYHDFAADPAKGMQTRFGDGGFIGRYPHARLQQHLPGAFQSWKVQQRLREPVTAPFLCFHGKPKQSDFPPDHPLRRHWEGSPR